jgi:hydroxymethylbilane synthase
MIQTMSVSPSITTLRLGTRGSLLARMQSQIIADALEKRHSRLKVELIICKTTGDKVQDRPLHEVGGKGVFTKELEEALLAGSIDFAVHSFKDVPVTMPLVDQSHLTIAAVPLREDARDVLVSTRAKTIRALPAGATIGTGSLRRKCQLLTIRPDLNIQPIRGNIDTRVRRLHERKYDAVIVAMAGLKRSGMFNDTDMNPIPLDEMLPAAAQAALAIQCRSEDESTRKVISVLDDPTTHLCVGLERDVVLALNGDCHSPIAAMATIESEKTLYLRAVIGSRGGELPVIRAEARADLSEPRKALESVLALLEKQHVRDLLAGRTGS